MRILVTGGCGYVGAHVVLRLQQDGHSIVVLDDLSTGHSAATSRVHLVRGDIRDASIVRRLTRRTDVIVHLAAIKDATGSLAHPGRVFSVNIEGSRVLLEAATEHGVTQLVFSSSAAVYGTPTRLPVTEAGPLAPQTPYGESKVAVERMLPWFERSGGPRWMALRYANAAGVHPNGDLGEATPTPTNLIPRAMAALTGRLPHVSIYGTDYPTPDGTAIRDYVHVVDLADGHARALAHLAAGGDSMACNLATGRGASVAEVIALASRVAGRPVPVVEAPRRSGDPAAIWLSPDRAHEMLSWKAAYGLEEIVASAWRWHSRHPDGYAAPLSR